LEDAYPERDTLTYSVFVSDFDTGLSSTLDRPLTFRRRQYEGAPCTQTPVESHRPGFVVAA
jgi:hypothetical protein